MTIEPALRDQAAHWAVLTGDPGFADWEAFTAWLEADPSHARAYDEVAAAVAEVVEARQAELADAAISPAANDNASSGPSLPRMPRRAWLGGALAASLAIVAVIGLLRSGQGDITYVTAPGETRIIALDDGSTMTLAGDTRLAMQGEDRREALLEKGQVLFDLRHDSGRPFVVRAGGDTIRDIGTIFEVRRLNRTTAVAVAEGAVLFNPSVQNLRVNPGQRAIHRDGAGKVEISAIPAGLVGEWREGRQTFRDASLADVAAALSGTTGVQFTVAPGAGDKRISGSVLIEPIARDPASLGPLLGVVAKPEGNRWVLEP